MDGTFSASIEIEQALIVPMDKPSVALLECELNHPAQVLGKAFEANLRDTLRMDSDLRRVFSMGKTIRDLTKPTYRLKYRGRTRPLSPKEIKQLVLQKLHNELLGMVDLSAGLHDFSELFEFVASQIERVFEKKEKVGDGDFLLLEQLNGYAILVDGKSYRKICCNLLNNSSGAA